MELSRNQFEQPIHRRERVELDKWLVAVEAVLASCELDNPQPAPGEIGGVIAEPTSVE